MITVEGSGLSKDRGRNQADQEKAYQEESDGKTMG
jgi:hypothetical protein